MTRLEPGSKVRIDCNHVDAPENLPDSQRMGWMAFFRGAVELTTDPEIDAKLYARGWLMAKNHKAYREALTWTLEAYEDGPDGETWAVLMRTEPRCLDDVYNGTGTGLGTVTLRERIKV